jgi:hypothetical protein
MKKSSKLEFSFTNLHYPKQKKGQDAPFEKIKKILRIEGPPNEIGRSDSPCSRSGYIFYTC